MKWKIKDLNLIQIKHKVEQEKYNFNKNFIEQMPRDKTLKKTIIEIEMRILLTDKRNSNKQFAT